MIHRNPKTGEGLYVAKSWHRPPGLAADWRGWSLMRGDEEVALHESVNAAYAQLDAMRKEEA